MYRPPASFYREEVAVGLHHGVLVPLMVNVWGWLMIIFRVAYESLIVHHVYVVLLDSLFLLAPSMTVAMFFEMRFFLLRHIALSIL